jgi:carboxypeptidase C (cathepsin A)
MKFDDPDAVNAPHNPPYYVENNELCMLDICARVFIDPVGTGWGRLLNPEMASRFYGIDEDAESFKNLIHTWLGRHQRWTSPKYLLGESYGTVRASVLADKLTGRGKDLSSVGINGIVLLGNAMGETDYQERRYSTEAILLDLPSMAAANWYHNDIPGTLKEFVDACYEFCAKDFLLALYAGNTLPEDERKAIAAKVAYFSGLTEKEVLKQDLRPNMRLSWQQVLEDKGLEIGRLDGRYTLPYGSRSGKEGVALTQYTPVFMAAINGPIKQMLNITHDREYYAIAGLDKFAWNRKSEMPPYECLAASMRRNDKMRVMFATGYYDMACTIGQARYLATHGGYPAERVEINEYPSGHMAYLGEESAKAFAADVRAFIK